MRRTQEAGGKKDLSRKVLGMAIGLLGMGVLLLAASVVLGSDELRLPVPYAMLMGFGLLVLYVVFRPAPDAASRPKNESAFFGNSTDFVSRLDRNAADEAPMALHRGVRPPATYWSARVFEEIEWRRFEALCASLFEGQAVESKHWLGKPVGIEEMREFHGLMVSHKLQSGTFASTSTFTDEARRFARENDISAVDGQGLLALISTRTPEQQQSLLAVAYEGEYWRPTCASCGVKMVEHTARGEGRSFWGCVHFPRCRFTLPVRAPGA